MFLRPACDGEGGGEKAFTGNALPTPANPYHIILHATHGNKGIYPLGCSPHVNDIITIDMLDLFLLFG